MYPFKQPLPASLSDTVLLQPDKTPKAAIDPRETGELVETKYDTNIDYVPNQDLTDIRAARQGNLEAFGNILGRFGGKLATRTLDGATFLATAPITMVYETLAGKVDGASSLVESAVNNPVSEWLREQETKLDAALPVYETNAQQNSIDVTSAGFVDKLFNGLAYVGSMALGLPAANLAGRGISAGLKGLSKLSGVAGGTRNLARVLAESPDLNYVTNLFADAAGLTDEIGKLKKGTNALKENATDFYAGAIESAAEASQTKEETVKKLTDEALKNNGGQPLSKEQIDAIELQGDRALALNFGMNILTTGAANKLVFHKLLNNKWSDDMVAYNKISKTGDQYVFNEAANKASKYQKLFNKVTGSEILKGAVTEGGQELSQFASNDFFVNLFSQPDADSVYKVRDTFGSLIEAVPEAAANTAMNLASKDAMESALIGGIIGAGFGGALNRGKDAKIAANTEALISNANKIGLTTSIKELAKSTQYSDAADGALLNGDRVTYETLKAAQIFDLVNSRDNIGKYDDLKQELNDARTMDLGEFKTRYDIKEKDYDESKRTQFIDYIEDIADKTKASKTKIMSNYGHKLTELEKENPDITGFLTMIDVLKEDYTKREGELFNKLAPYMKYDEMVANRLTPEKLENFQQQISTLQQEATSIQREAANTAEALTDRTNRLTKVVNQINDLQTSIAMSPTELNYKEFLKIEGLDDEKLIKKVKEPTRYAEYTKDLNDFKTIQESKEKLIDYYSKIVNDVDYAKKVQGQINLANQSEIINNLFSLDLNEKVTPRVDATGQPILSSTGEAQNDYSYTQSPTGEKGKVQDYIRPGDIYKLHEKQISKIGNKYTNIDTAAPYEVLNTSVEMINGVPVGTVELKGQRGDKLKMNVNKFKQSIVPVFGKNLELKHKYDQEADNIRIYKLFKDRAIKYDINGKEVVGMLGFSPTSSNAEDLVIKYFDDNGKLRNEPFKTAQFNKDYQRGYVQILSERATLAYQLNTNAKKYMNVLLKTVDTKTKSLGTTAKRIQDLQSRLKVAELNNNSIESTAIVNAIQSYERFIDKLNNEIEIKQEAADRLNQLENIDLTKSEELGDDFNKIIDQIIEYRDSARNLPDNNGARPKQSKTDRIKKAFEIEIDGETQNVNVIRKELNQLKQDFVSQVASRIDPTQANQITDAELNPTLDLQYVEAVKFAEENALAEELANAENINRTQGLIESANDRINDEVLAIEDAYTREVLASTNLTPDDIKLLKTAEMSSIMQFIKFINERNFFKSNNTTSSNRRASEAEYKLPEPGEEINFVTKRPSFRLKTTGSSENTDSLTKKEFYRNIHKLDITKNKVRVAKESEYSSLGLTGGENDIFLVVTDNDGKDVEFNNNKLVTTLPLNTLTDTVGFRFSNFETDGQLSPSKKEIGSKIDIALQNSTDIYETINTVTDQLKIDYPTEIAFIDELKGQVEDLQRLRDQITQNRNANISISLTGKSNGIPRLGNPTLVGDEAFTENGKIVVADSTSYQSAGNDYSTSPGRAYFEDSTTNTFFPVIVDRLGNKPIVIKGKTKKTTFVDNIIGAGKFLQASLIDKAVDFEGNVVSPADALSRVNTSLSYILYTNKNVDKPDSLFEFGIEDNQVVFYIGSTTPLRLNGEEATIRGLLSNKLFNVDRKSLDNETIKFAYYQEKDGNIQINYNTGVSYQEFIKDNFGFATNIRPNKDGSLYKNGYLVLDNNISVTKSLVSTLQTEGEVASTDPFANTETETPNSTTSSSTGGSLLASLAGNGIAPAGSDPFSGAAVNPTPRADGTVSFDDIMGTNKPKTNRKKLTNIFYKGDVSNLMTPAQYKAAEKRFAKYGIELETVKGLIDNDAFGLVSEAADVLISDKAPKGTDYHEEFHVVSQHLLSPEQLNDLYSEWRSKNDSSASDDVVEEELAEGWRLVRQGYEGFTGKIKAIFDYLYNKIKALIGLGSKQDQLFSDIYFGKYYGRPVYKGTKAYKSAVNSIPYEVRQKAFSGATRQFVNNLVQSFGKNVLFTEVPDGVPLTPAQANEAINILTTDKDARLDYLNYTEDNGASFMQEMVNDSLRDYFNNVTDLTTNQVLSLLKENGQINEFIDQYNSYLTKALNLKGLEESDIDENTTGRDIVKKGDNDTDFFADAITQTRLLAYSQPDLSGIYPINPGTLAKIYMDNLADSTNSADFEDKLKKLPTDSLVNANFGKEYLNAIRNINEIIGLSAGANRTKAQQFMIGNLWSSFAKKTTDFKILKVGNSEEEGINIDYRWVSASYEQGISNSYRDVSSGIKDNYVASKALVQSSTKNSKGEIIVSNPSQVFESLYNVSYDKFNKYSPNKVQSMINSFARSKNAEEYIKNYNSDVRLISEYISSNNPEKVHSFFNAGNKLQHSLQNPSSLTYRIRDINKDSDILTIDRDVVLNGVQKTLGSRDNENVTADDLTDLDLHILFFNSMIPSNKVGSKIIMPFIFSGDKSTLTGIEMTPKKKLSFSNSFKDRRVNGNVEFYIDHNEIYSEYLANELQDLEYIIENNAKSISAKGKEELPFFSFLRDRNEGLYNSIIKDVKNKTKNKETLENISARYKEEVLEETQEHFKQKAVDLKKLFDSIGFDYSDVILSRGIGVAQENDQLVLNWYTSAYAIGVQEQTKLTGSLAYYADPAKRLPAWNGTKRAIRTDSDWVNWYNKTYRSNIDIADLRALVVNDVKTQQDIIDEGVYDDNNPADAQAYISLDAARFLLFSSGQTYNLRLDDVFRELETLDKKANLTKQDIDTVETLVSEVNEYMNVLKPQYYGMQKLENGLEIPTFYKFSVLPLTKAITQGRNLDSIRDLMNAKDSNGNNIGPHLVMFDSANKVGRNTNEALNLYDDKGNFIFNNIPVEEKLASLQKSSWEGLGIQVDMPKPHDNNTFGTQMRKLITVDLPKTLTIKGKETSDVDVRKAVNDIIIEKTSIDEANLMQKLGLTSDLTVTPDKINGVRKQLIRQAISRDFSNQFIESIRTLNSYDFIGNKSKIQQLVNSIVSKGIIKQKMTGDAKAMVSSVLFEKAGGGIQFDNRLKFYKKGKQSYMEVLLPNNMKDQYSDYIEYNTTENLYTFKANAPESIKKLIGYRIPTQSPMSIENIVIKGFVANAYGNAVIVPFEITSKAGSDFDIDKLNLFMPKFDYSVNDSELGQLLHKLPEELFPEGQTRVKYYKVLEETLAEDLEPNDYTILKFVKENAKGKYKYSKDHINNRIIDLFTSIMEAPEYFDNFVGTIDEKDFKVLAQQIGKDRKLKKSAADMKAVQNFYDPIFAANTRSAFTNGKKTLGAAAVATTHHAESQKFNLAINSTNLENGKYARVVKGEGTAATLGELLSLFDERVIENGKIRLDRIFNFENKKISGILSQVVNASVDIVKDEYITSANLDLETVGVASLMVRSGIPISKIFKFISQPGIIEYTDKLRRTKMSTMPAVKKQTVRDSYIKGDYLRLNKNSFDKLDVAPRPLDSQQLDFIDLYKNLEEYAQMLTDLQQITNFDTKGTGSMLEENEINLLKYDTFKFKYSRLFSGLESMLDSKESFTANFREKARKAINFNNSLFKLGEYYTPKSDGTVINTDLKKTLDNINNLKTTTSDKTNKAFRFKSFFNSYLLQRIALSNDASFPTIVARTVPEVKNFNGQNAFIKRLRTGDNKLFINNGASINADEANLLGESFTELYNTPATRPLAQNIILSGLFQFGLVNNPSTIMNVIPTTLLLDTLKITSTDPITEAYNKVLLVDGTLAKAVDNAFAHSKAAKGSNHFSNYTLIKPQVTFTETNQSLAEEDPSNC